MVAGRVPFLSRAFIFYEEIREPGLHSGDTSV